VGSGERLMKKKGFKVCKFSHVILLNYFNINLMKITKLTLLRNIKTKKKSQIKLLIKRNYYYYYKNRVISI